MNVFKPDPRTSRDGSNPPGISEAPAPPLSPSRRVAAWSIGCALLAFSHYGVAQITSPGGPQSQDNGTSAMGSKPDDATSAVHESHKPQAKDAKANARGKTAAKNSPGGGHRPEGAGGFDNGLEGTGAGSNK
ncbi:beta-xylosidase [Paraburkholderia sp.]|uniref:beta-xylosidase n=1 Tax=Paraburkholderia sp. TaxID=1926495 RepID=UPI0023903D3A|nr:beta-xylosidase [Paraburkholderia sp.]MDE1182302.1 beta-xylosidase [Paraburkholderia sp.]